MRTRVFLVLAVILLFGPSQAEADQIYQAVDFSTADLVFSSSEGFDIIYLKGCEITDQVENLSFR